MYMKRHTRQRLTSEKRRHAMLRQSPVADKLIGGIVVPIWCWRGQGQRVQSDTVTTVEVIIGRYLVTTECLEDG